MLSIEQAIRVTIRSNKNLIKVPNYYISQPLEFTLQECAFEYTLQGILLLNYQLN